jgi:hypothetical protein
MMPRLKYAEKPGVFPVFTSTQSLQGLQAESGARFSLPAGPSIGTTRYCTAAASRAE